MTISNCRALVAGILLLLLSAVVHAQQWHPMPGLARGIGVGARGDVWVIGVDQVPGGSSIYRWTGSDWQIVAGGAVRIAVDPQGYPWVVNSAGQILRLTPGGWEALPGLASDIGIGADGTVWVVGVTPTAGGFTIHRWNGHDWELLPGGAVRIEVDPGGNPWVVNDRGDVARYYRGAWTPMAHGFAKEIAIGTDGTAWMLTHDRTSGGYEVRRWTGHQWRRLEASAVGIGAVAIGAGPVPWLVNDAGNIFRRDARR